MREKENNGRNACYKWKIMRRNWVKNIVWRERLRGKTIVLVCLFVMGLNIATGRLINRRFFTMTEREREREKGERRKENKRNIKRKKKR